MKNGNDIFWEIQRTLGWEFDRYVLSHPDIEIPANAIISFRIKGNEEFNKWSKDITNKTKERNQPILLVEVEGLAPPPPLTSRLINPHLELSSK